MKALVLNDADIARANAAFCDESRAFQFKFRCEDCAHVAGSESSCSMGYPNHFLKGPVRAIMQSGDLAFCKYFELGEQTLESGG